MQATDAQIEDAARALMRGELVAFPTETVYGLGADASAPRAVSKIYAAKGRPSNHPVIVHVAKPSDIQAWCSDIPNQAWALAQAFWPGPLTMILRRNHAVDASVSAGQDTIGVRCPSHPIAHALLTTFSHMKTQAGEVLAGVAAPSANRFGRVSPTQAQHVRTEFVDLVQQGMPVLEGGDSEVGIESTIVDLSSLSDGGSVALLRPGAITSEQIEAVLGCNVAGQTKQSPRVSGSLKAHYAPTTPLMLCPAASLGAWVEGWLQAHEGRLALMSRSDFKVKSDRIEQVLMPQAATDYARELYASLRRIDELSVNALVIEQVPSDTEWAGVADRLSRAAAAFEEDSSC